MLERCKFKLWQKAVFLFLVFELSIDFNVLTTSECRNWFAVSKIYSKAVPKYV